MDTESYAIAIKATSNEALYAGDERRRQGCGNAIRPER